MMELAPQELVTVNVSDDGCDGVLHEDFEPADAPPGRVFDVLLSTGREWESEELDDEGVTIRTKPDPRLQLYPHEGDYVLALLAGPVVALAIRIGHDTPEATLRRAVAAIEDDYDGIEEIVEMDYASDYGNLADVVAEQVDQVTP